ncbi:hypothetical protein NQZ68_007695 [Dissostichus eleginoides]|nr:hypothetical protein NQZ68_007695 [Dissostichus eleginoides]
MDAAAAGPLWDPSRNETIKCLRTEDRFLNQLITTDKAHEAIRKGACQSPIVPSPLNLPSPRPAIDSQLLTGAREKPEASWELQVHLWHWL